MLRLFVALSLPDTIKTQVFPMKSGLPGARWIEQENLHLTIRFIGNVEETFVEDIHYALSRVRFESFHICLKGVNIFRSRDRVRSVWVGINPTEQLKALQKQIETILIGGGVTAEKRKFTPHVTLARLNQTPITKVVPYLETNAGFKTPPFEVFQVLLFQSHLRSQKADYEIIAAYPSNL